MKRNIGRKDAYRNTLKQGESQRKDGKYDYRWTDELGKRHSIYADTLKELRFKKEDILRDRMNGIKIENYSKTVDDMFKIWCDLKRGLKDNTKQNYIYMYNTFVSPLIGKKRLKDLKRSNIKKYYNTCVDERNLKFATIDNIHTVLHQVLQMAVDDDFIRKNPADNQLKELKQSHNFDTEKRHALTQQQQDLFLSYLKESPQYSHWYPIFAFMLWTGLRVGEVTGLRWRDILYDDNTVSVNHTLVYYSHANNKCYFGINTPKTEAGKRNVTLLTVVKEALQMEREYQISAGIVSNARVDGFDDFIFVNRFGNVQHQGTLNKALRRIIRDCNDELLLKDPNATNLLPPFSCHNLRHTFATRLCEKNVNIKVIQKILGHKDIATTMQIYAEATKDFTISEMEKMEVTDALWMEL